MKMNKRGKGETKSFTMPFFPKGKKGVMDDMFDFLFTVVALFFILTFVSFSITSGINQANKETVENVAEINRIDSAINHLKTQSVKDSGIDPTKIEETIKNSKILGGVVITDCNDYIDQVNCDKNMVNIHEDSDRYCKWNENLGKCEIKLRSISYAKPGKP